MPRSWADAWITFGDSGGGDSSPAGTEAAVRTQIKILEARCAEIGRDPRAVDRIFLVGNTDDRPLESLAAFEEFAGRYGELGITDLVFHDPRPDDPAWDDPENPGTQRYWDGATWAAVTPPPPPPESSTTVNVVTQVAPAPGTNGFAVASGAGHPVDLVDWLDPGSDIRSSGEEGTGQAWQCPERFGSGDRRSRARVHRSRHVGSVRHSDRGHGFLIALTWA
jgi:hypothetical protein